MKTLVTLAILEVTGLAGAAGAEANDGRHNGPERRPEHVRQYRHEQRPEHRRERIWIAPRYETRIVRYECGRPVYGQVLISAGHWSFQFCD